MNRKRDEDVRVAAESVGKSMRHASRVGLFAEDSWEQVRQLVLATGPCH